MCLQDFVVSFVDISAALEFVVGIACMVVAEAAMHMADLVEDMLARTVGYYIAVDFVVEFVNISAALESVVTVAVDLFEMNIVDLFERTVGY